MHERTRRGRAAVLPALALALARIVTPASAQEGAPAGAEETTATDARILELHHAAILVDGHNDLPWRIRGNWGLDFGSVDFSQRRTDGHTDLVRLREGGVDVQFWAAYVPARFIGPRARVIALEQIDLIKRFTEGYPEHLEMAYSLADIRRITNEGRIASMIGIEGGHAITNSLPALQEMYASGARYMTLTHSATLAWVDAAGDEPRHGGLTDFGREVVREMNRLGMLVDVSHVTAEAARDALEVTRAPVIFSHSSARAIADHPRNVPDDVLRMVRDNGGVVMVNFYSGFLDPEGARNVEHLFREEARIRRENPDPEAFQREMDAWYADHPTPAGDVGSIADHIDHIVQVAGIDHAGLGSDFDGVPMLPEGMEDVSRFPALTGELVRREYSDEDVRKILGGNFLRVLGEVEATARALSGEPARSERLPFEGLEPADRGPAGSEETDSGRQPPATDTSRGPS